MMKFCMNKMESFSWKLHCIILTIIWNFDLYEGLNTTSNVAFGKSTMQSSTISPAHLSNLANDGNTQQNGPGGLIKDICAHTIHPPAPNEWWIVNLGAIFDICLIIIYGRTEQHADRFQDFDVDVISPVRLTDNLTFNTVDLGKVTFRKYVPSPVTKIEIDCPDTTLGQFVRLRHRGTRMLTICEVEVYGELATCVKAPDMSKFQGYPGHRYEGEVIQTKPARSAIQCMGACKNVHCCYAATFNIKTKQCDLRRRTESAGLITDTDWNTLLIF